MNKIMSLEQQFISTAICIIYIKKLQLDDAA